MRKLKGFFGLFSVGFFALLSSDVFTLKKSYSAYQTSYGQMSSGSHQNEPLTPLNTKEEEEKNKVKRIEEKEFPPSFPRAKDAFLLFFTNGNFIEPKRQTETGNRYSLIEDLTAAFCGKYSDSSKVKQQPYIDYFPTCTIAIEENRGVCYYWCNIECNNNPSWYECPNNNNKPQCCQNKCSGCFYVPSYCYFYIGPSGLICPYDGRWYDDNRVIPPKRFCDCKDDRCERSDGCFLPYRDRTASRDFITNIGDLMHRGKWKVRWNNGVPPYDPDISPGADGVADLSTFEYCEYRTQDAARDPSACIGDNIFAHAGYSGSLPPDPSSGEFYGFFQLLEEQLEEWLVSCNGRRVINNALATQGSCIYVPALRSTLCLSINEAPPDASCPPYVKNRDFHSCNYYPDNWQGEPLSLWLSDQNKYYCAEGSEPGKTPFDNYVRSPSCSCYGKGIDGWVFYYNKAKVKITPNKFTQTLDLTIILWAEPVNEWNGVAIDPMNIPKWNSIDSLIRWSDDAWGFLWEGNIRGRKGNNYYGDVPEGGYHFVADAATIQDNGPLSIWGSSVPPLSEGCIDLRVKSSAAVGVSFLYGAGTLYFDFIVIHVKLKPVFQDNVIDLCVEDVKFDIINKELCLRALTSFTFIKKFAGFGVNPHGTPSGPIIDSCSDVLYIDLTGVGEWVLNDIYVPLEVRDSVIEPALEDSIRDVIEKFLHGGKQSPYCPKYIKPEKESLDFYKYIPIGASMHWELFLDDDGYIGPPHDYRDAGNNDFDYNQDWKVNDIYYYYTGRKKGYYSSIFPALGEECPASDEVPNWYANQIWGTRPQSVINFLYTAPKGNIFGGNDSFSVTPIFPLDINKFFGGKKIEEFSELSDSYSKDTVVEFGQNKYLYGCQFGFKGCSIHDAGVLLAINTAFLPAERDYLNCSYPSSLSPIFLTHSKTQGGMTASPSGVDNYYVVPARYIPESVIDSKTQIIKQGQFNPYDFYSFVFITFPEFTTYFGRNYFKFYGENRYFMKIFRNGYISFDFLDFPVNYPTPVPSHYLPNNFIAAFFTRLEQENEYVYEVTAYADKDVINYIKYNLIMDPSQTQKIGHHTVSDTFDGIVHTQRNDGGWEWSGDDYSIEPAQDDDRVVCLEPETDFYFYGEDIGTFCYSSNGILYFPLSNPADLPYHNPYNSIPFPYNDAQNIPNCNHTGYWGASNVRHYLNSYYLDDWQAVDKEIWDNGNRVGGEGQTMMALYQFARVGKDSSMLWDQNVGMIGMVYCAGAQEPPHCVREWIPTDHRRKYWCWWCRGEFCNAPKRLGYIQNYTGRYCSFPLPERIGNSPSVHNFIAPLWMDLVPMFVKRYKVFYDDIFDSWGADPTDTGDCETPNSSDDYGKFCLAWATCNIFPGTRKRLVKCSYIGEPIRSGSKCVWGFNNGIPSHCKAEWGTPFNEHDNPSDCQCDWGDEIWCPIEEPPGNNPNYDSDGITHCETSTDYGVPCECGECKLTLPSLGTYFVYGKGSVNRFRATFYNQIQRKFFNSKHADIILWWRVSPYDMKGGEEPDQWECNNEAVKDTSKLFFAPNSIMDCAGDHPQCLLSDKHVTLGGCDIPGYSIAENKKYDCYTIHPYDGTSCAVPSRTPFTTCAEDPSNDTNPSDNRISVGEIIKSNACGTEETFAVMLYYDVNSPYTNQPGVFEICYGNIMIPNYEFDGKEWVPPKWMTKVLNIRGSERDIPFWQAGIESHNGRTSIEVIRPSSGKCYLYIPAGRSNNLCGVPSYEIRAGDIDDDGQGEIVIKWKNFHVKGLANCASFAVILKRDDRPWAQDTIIIQWGEDYPQNNPFDKMEKLPPEDIAPVFVGVEGILPDGTIRGVEARFPGFRQAIKFVWHSKFAYMMGLGISQDLITDLAEMFYKSGSMCLAVNSKSPQYKNIPLPVSLEPGEWEFIFPGLKGVCDPDAGVEIRLTPGRDPAVPLNPENPPQLLTLPASARTSVSWDEIFKLLGMGMSESPQQKNYALWPPVVGYPWNPNNPTPDPHIFGTLTLSTDFAIVFPYYGVDILCQEDDGIDGVATGDLKNPLSFVHHLALGLDIQFSRYGAERNINSPLWQITDLIKGSLMVFGIINPILTNVNYFFGVPSTQQISGILDILGEIFSSWLGVALRTKIELPLDFVKELEGTRKIKIWFSSPDILPVANFTLDDIRGWGKQPMYNIRGEGPDVNCVGSGCSEAGDERGGFWNPNYVGDYIGIYIDYIFGKIDWNELFKLTSNAAPRFGIKTRRIEEESENERKLETYFILPDGTICKRCKIPIDKAVELGLNSEENFALKVTYTGELTPTHIAVSKDGGIFSVPFEFKGEVGIRKMWQGWNKIEVIGVVPGTYIESPPASIEIQIDTIPPEIDVVKVSGAVAHVDVKDNNPQGIEVRYSVDGGSWSDWVSSSPISKAKSRATITLGNLNDGPHKVYVQAKDKAGNISGMHVFDFAPPKKEGCQAINVLTLSQIILFGILIKIARKGGKEKWRGKIKKI